MSTKTIKVYECDICHSQFNKASDLSVLVLPATYHISADNTRSTTLESIDVCDECRSILDKIIWDNFAELSSTISGIKSVTKYDKEVKKRKTLNEGT